MTSFRIIGLYVVMGLPILLILAEAFWKNASHPGFAEELSVSAAIFADANKFRDLLLTPVLLAAQVVGAIVVFYLHSRMTSGQSSAQMQAKLRLWSSLVVLTTLLLGGIFGVLPPVGLAGALFVALLMTWTYDDAWELALGKVTVITAAIVLTVNNLTNLPYQYGFIFSLMAAVLCAVRSPLGRTLLEAGYLLSTAAIAIMLAMCAPLFWLPGRSILTWTILDVAIVGLAVFSIVQALRVALKSDARGSVELVGPSILTLAIGLALLATPEQANLILSNDDYHLGEKLSAVRAIFHDHNLFTQLMPAHGLSDALGGLIGWLGADSAASGVIWGEQYAEFLGRIATLYLLLRFVPGVCGILLAIVVPLPYLRLSHLPALSLAILSLAFVKRAWFAGALAAMLCAVCIFLAGGVGAAVAVSTFVALTISFSWQRPNRAISFLTGAAVAGAVIVAAFFRPAVDWAEYLLISAKTNATIYGIGEVATPIRIETLIEHFFLVLPSVAFLAALAANYAHSREKRSLAQSLLTAVPLAMLVILLNSYVMTRGYPRAMICTLLTTFCFIGTMVVLRPSVPRTLLTGIALIPLAGLYANQPTFKPYIYQQSADVQLLPPQNRLSATIDTRGLGLGYAVGLPGHVASLLSLKTTIDEMLEPDEPILNLTNRSALSYYLDHSAVGIVTSAYNNAPAAFQTESLRELEKNPPRLAIVSAHNQEHDGYSLALRSYGLYQFLLKNYAPLEIDGVLYGWRKDLTLPTNSSSSEAPVVLTDINWTNGVGIGANKWSFFVKPHVADQLNLGDVLVFRDGTQRSILEMEGANILVDGPKLDPNGGNLNRFEPIDRPFRTSDIKNPIDLWNTHFALEDYGQIPSAWGRSLRRLEDNMADIKIELIAEAANDVEPVPERPGQFSTTGPDPYWNIELPTTANPTEFGLLKFEFSCSNLGLIPIQVFWRSSHTDYNETASFSFTASYDVNVIPLDVIPLWLMATEISDIRIDIGQGDATCESVELRNLELLKRKPL